MASRIGAFVLAISILYVGLDDICERNAQQSFSCEVVSVEEAKCASHILVFHRISKWVYIFTSQHHQTLIPAYYVSLMQCV
jgi:hypothetical protein